MTERGCSWRCAFCAEWRGEHVRSVEDVIAEIEEAKTYGYGAIFFDDSTFLSCYGREAEETGSSNEHAIARRKLQARKLFLERLLHYLGKQSLEWGCQTRVDTIDPKMLQRMREAGCTYIYFGAESASADQLSDMTKHQSRREIAAAFEHVRDAGIRIGLSTLFGMPSQSNPLLTRETERSIDETIAFFAREVQRGGIVIVSRNITAYYPGSLTSYAAAKSMNVDFWKGMPLRGRDGIPWPWNRFEDRAGNHAQNVTIEMAERIARRGDQLLGPWSIKSYIHPTPDRSATTHDFVHYTNIARGGNETERAATSSAAFRSSASTTWARHASFREALRSGLSASLDRWNRPVTPTIVLGGMHVLEAVRGMAYLHCATDRLRPPSRGPLHEWRGVWDAAMELELVQGIVSSNLSRAAAIVVPAVLPETGQALNLSSLAQALRDTRFAGDLWIDCSDAMTADMSDIAVVVQKASWARTQLLLSPARVFDVPGHCWVGSANELP